MHRPFLSVAQDLFPANRHLPKVPHSFLPTASFPHPWKDSGSAPSFRHHNLLPVPPHILSSGNVPSRSAVFRSFPLLLIRKTEPSFHTTPFFLPDCCTIHSHTLLPESASAPRCRSPAGYALQHNHKADVRYSDWTVAVQYHCAHAGYPFSRMSVPKAASSGFSAEYPDHFQHHLQFLLPPAPHTRHECQAEHARRAFWN